MDTSGIEKLTYESARAMPLGTVVRDTAGYWAAQNRHYVKTSPNTWALFFHSPNQEEIWQAVDEGRNNISPAPIGNLMAVELPEPVEELFPGTLAALDRLTVLA